MLEGGVVCGLDTAGSVDVHDRKGQVQVLDWILMAA
jgi:hypothetical protein